MNGVKIFFLEGVAGFGGREHFAREREGFLGVAVGDGGVLGRQRFVNPDHKFRDVVQPIEPRMFDDQAEELAGVYGAVLFFVAAALHIQKSFVDTKKRVAELREGFARGGRVGAASAAR